MASSINASTAGAGGLISTADASGVLQLQTAGTTAATVDASQNVGVGVTPSAWSSAYVGNLQTQGGAIFGTTGSETNYGMNAYYNAGYKYVATGYASVYQQYAGQHIWKTAASGTAGNAISFTQAMTLDASGNLGIGTSSPQSRLHVSDPVAGGQLLVTNNETNNGAKIGSLATMHHQNAEEPVLAISIEGGASENILQIGGGPGEFNAATVIKFSTAANTTTTGGTERARIDSSGRLLVGLTSTNGNAGGAILQASQANSGGGWVSFIDNTQATGAVYCQYLSLSGQVPNNSTSAFLLCKDFSTERLRVYSNGGIANYSANNVNLSDRREKTNFAPAKSYLDVICSIPVQTYNYIDQNLEEDAGLTLGVVAQDVQAVAPELVSEANWGTEEDPKMRLSIYQTDLQYALMKCIQEQQVMIQQLQADVAALKG